MSFGFGGWGDLMVVHSSISCEVVTSASTSRAEDIVLGGGRRATGQGGDLPACRRDSYAAVVMQGLRKTAATLHTFLELLLSARIQPRPCSKRSRPGCDLASTVAMCLRRRRPPLFLLVCGGRRLPLARIPEPTTSLDSGVAASPALPLLPVVRGPMPPGVVAPYAMKAGIDTVFMFGDGCLGLFDVRNFWFFTYHGFLTITSSSHISSR
jgi:hypothetical protein